MEDKNFLDITVQLRLEKLGKLKQVCLLINLYCDNKKVLKYLQKIVAIEDKNFRNSYFSQAESSFNEIVGFMVETKMIIKDFRSAKTVEAFNYAKKRINVHLESLEEALHPSIVQGIIDKAKSKVKELKNIAIEKLEKLKDGVCERKENDSESV